MNHVPRGPVASTVYDIMTTPVLHVAPETTVRDAARMLLDHRIGAVPVVDDQGALVGMVSEGDLLGRNSTDRLSKHEWWLAMLATPGHTEMAITDAALGRLVRDVMHKPVVTIDENASGQDAAMLLRKQGIKRLPVMRNGAMIGLVARADLLRIVEAIPSRASNRSPGGLGDMLAGFFGNPGVTTRDATASAPTPAAAGVPTAEGFRHLLKQSNQAKIDEKKATVHAAELARIDEVKTMLHQHVGKEMWTTLLTHARVTAAHGGKEIQMLRFPAYLCSDSGRKINNAKADRARRHGGTARVLRLRERSR